jgi:cell division protease FtsH
VRRRHELIDEEVKKMVNEQYERAKKVLAEYRDKHKELADLLIAKEVVFAEDVERIFGKRKWTSRSLEIIMDDKRHEDEGKVEPKGKENKDEKEGEDKTDKKQPAKKAEAPSLFDENKDKGETTSEDNNQPS